VTLHYIDDLGTRDVSLQVNPHSRQTAVVADPAHYGIGRPYVGVSTVVTSDQPIVAERPMYMVHDFGTGSVKGAHDVVGATARATLFGFADASTASGDNDYLTIENNNATTASITIDYYSSNGKVGSKTLSVAGNTRHTVLIFQTAGGVGPGISPLGMVVSADHPVIVEKPTYSSNIASYGATDTMGYSPAGGF